MPPHYSLFSGLDIPAGEKDFVIRDSYTLPVAVDGVGVSAHAHYIATQMKMTATLPGRRSENAVADQGLGFCLAGPVLFQAIRAVARRNHDSMRKSIGTTRRTIRTTRRTRRSTSTWGEESKDEMGSISLIAVPHDEADLATLQEDTRRRNRQVARERMRDDPALARKVMQMLAE